MGNIILEASKKENPKLAAKFLKENATHPAFKVIAKYWVQTNPFSLPEGTPPLPKQPSDGDPYVDGLYQRAKTLYVLEKHGSLEFSRPAVRENWYLNFITDLVPEDVQLMEWIKDGIFPGILDSNVIEKVFLK